MNAKLLVLSLLAACAASTSEATVPKQTTFHIAFNPVCSNKYFCAGKHDKLSGSEAYIIGTGPISGQSEQPGDELSCNNESNQFTREQPSGILSYRGKQVHLLERPIYGGTQVLVTYDNSKKTKSTSRFQLVKKGNAHTLRLVRTNQCVASFVSTMAALQPCTIVAGTQSETRILNVKSRSTSNSQP